MVATPDADTARCGERKEEVGGIEASFKKKPPCVGRFRSYQFAGAQTPGHECFWQKYC
jgi:hypothetical protein